MTDIEAPAFTQSDLNAILLTALEKMGLQDGDRSQSFAPILDAAACVATSARTIGYHDEVGRRYLRERIWRTTRDGLRDEDAPERRPCIMSMSDETFIVRCEDYRPFRLHENKYGGDGKWKRTERRYPLLLTKVRSLQNSAAGLLYCAVLGPKDVGSDDLQDKTIDQHTLDFPVWNNAIVVPMRDIIATGDIHARMDTTVLALPKRE